MKQWIVFSLALAASASLLAPSASARTVQSRVVTQKYTIRQGVRHGTLTHEEALRLRRHERRIARQMRTDRRTNHMMTARERARLERELDRQRRHIYRREHNLQYRR